MVISCLHIFPFYLLFKVYSLCLLLFSLYSQNLRFFLYNKKSCSIHTLYQLSKVLKISTDDLLYGGKVEEKIYSDEEIINNIIKKCNEKQLKIIKDVLIAMFPNFDELKE